MDKPINENTFNSFADKLKTLIAQTETQSQENKQNTQSQIQKLNSLQKKIYGK